MISPVHVGHASNPTLQDITGNIYEVLSGKQYELPKEKTDVKLPVEKLKEYEGEYKINKDLHVIINVKDGELVAAPTGQPTSVLLAKREDFFFLISPDIQIDFTRDDKKIVNGFILHQNGSNLKCNKIK